MTKGISLLAVSQAGTTRRFCDGKLLISTPLQKDEALQRAGQALLAPNRCVSEAGHSSPPALQHGSGTLNKQRKI